MGSSLKVIQVFRQPTRGVLEALTRYTLYVNDVECCKISFGELKELDVTSDSGNLRVVRSGDQEGERISFDSSCEGRTLIITPTVKKAGKARSIRLEWASDEVLTNKLFRFDRQTFARGSRRFGMFVGVLTTTCVSISVPFLVAVLAWKMFSQPEITTILFLTIVGGFLVLGLSFVSFVGLRAIYFYFRLPKKYQN